MKNKVIFLSFIILFGFTAGICLAKYSGGDGSESTPYRISDANDMNNIGIDSNDWDRHFLMTADINMADYAYTTALIAPDTDNTNWNFDGISFAGTFDGNNFKIVALIITTGDKNNHLGLFGMMDVNSHITNLTLEDVNITSGNNSGYLGGLCGQNRGTISNCYVTSSVNGGYYLGGLCGYNDGGTISNCTVTSFVTGDADIGGLCGNNVNGTISDCFVSGSATSIGRYSGNIGGLCGCDINGIIINCKTTGSVIDRGYGFGWIGGLCGDSYRSTISNCTASGPVTGGEGSFDIGGLCGRNADGTINSCIANSPVDGDEGSEAIGGLCGYNTFFGKITNCYATGSISSGANSGYLGGLCGDNGGAIKNCYATGTVATGNNPFYLGSLVGYNRSGNYTKSFWDSTVNTDVNGIGNLTDPNVIGETTENMQTESTFTSAGWDFVGETANGANDIWWINEGKSYPRLWWENIEPVELLDILGQDIIDLDLQPGIENSLLAKLDAALQKLEDDNENNDTAAINLLEAFIKTVEAQYSKKIPKANADALIEAARKIIELLNDE